MTDYEIPSRRVAYDDVRAASNPYLLPSRRDAMLQEARASVAEAWADLLATVLFLAIVDADAHAAEITGVLSDYRAWIAGGRQ